MIQTNVLTPLPFYPATNIEQGKAFWQSRKWWADRVYPLCFPVGYLPVFQCGEFGNGEAVTKISVRNMAGVEVFAINNPVSTQPTKFAMEEKTLLSYGTAVLSGQTEGRYYIVVTGDDGTKFVSEVWTAVSESWKYLLLEWWDDADFETEQGTIYYDGTYKNKLYIAAELAKPEYVFDEEGEERDGYFYPEKMISTKKYHFAFTAPEYLLDALRFVRLSDHIKITAGWLVPAGVTPPSVVYSCDSFLLTPEWVETGEVATVNVEFTAGTVAKKISQ